MANKMLAARVPEWMVEHIDSTGMTRSEAVRELVSMGIVLAQGIRLAAVFIGQVTESTQDGHGWQSLAEELVRS